MQSLKKIHVWAQMKVPLNRNKDNILGDREIELGGSGASLFISGEQGKRCPPTPWPGRPLVWFSPLDLELNR